MPSGMGLKVWGIVDRWLWSLRCGGSGPLWVSILYYVFSFNCVSWVKRFLNSFIQVVLVLLSYSLRQMVDYLTSCLIRVWRRLRSSGNCSITMTLMFGGMGLWGLCKVLSYVWMLLKLVSMFVVCECWMLLKTYVCDAIVSWNWFVKLL